MTAKLSTRDRILICAEGLIQTRGYNGFSFRDIAEGIGIRNASVHYYYPKKTDLVLAVATKYRSDYSAIVRNLPLHNGTAIAILSAYADLFEATLISDDKLCLGGMLASEVNNLDSVLQLEIKIFFEDQARFLTDVLLQGISNGEIDSGLETAVFAKTYLATIEGAMVLARLNNKPADIQVSARQMLSLIKA